MHLSAGPTPQGRSQVRRDTSPSAALPFPIRSASAVVGVRFPTIEELAKPCTPSPASNRIAMNSRADSRFMPMSRRVPHACRVQRHDDRDRRNGSPTCYLPATSNSLLAQTQHYCHHGQCMVWVNLVVISDDPTTTSIYRNPSFASGETIRSWLKLPTRLSRFSPIPG